MLCTNIYFRLFWRVLTLNDRSILGLWFLSRLNPKEIQIISKAHHVGAIPGKPWGTQQLPEDPAIMELPRYLVRRNQHLILEELGVDEDP